MGDLNEKLCTMTGPSNSCTAIGQLFLPNSCFVIFVQFSIPTSEESSWPQSINAASFPHRNPAVHTRGGGRGHCWRVLRGGGGRRERRRESLGSRDSARDTLEMTLALSTPVGKNNHRHYLVQTRENINWYLDKLHLGSNFPEPENVPFRRVTAWRRRIENPNNDLTVF